MSRDTFWRTLDDGTKTPKQVVYEKYQDGVYPPGLIGVGEVEEFDKRLCIWWEEACGKYNWHEFVYEWNSSTDLCTRLWFNRHAYRWYLQTMKVRGEDKDDDFMWTPISFDDAQKWFETVELGDCCVNMTH